MTDHKPHVIRALFTGFRRRIDRLRLEQRRTGVKREPTPGRPQVFRVIQGGKS